MTPLATCDVNLKLDELAGPQHGRALQRTAASARQLELLEDWTRAQARQPLNKIEPVE